ncbi:MAG: SGNH/GDSL hydrolase family protein [Arenimonas sp.]|nr:SGNH/GDSL hydrolase family protein [Arenimonas sp.]MBP7917142.1 SGNH/GDSL hydrolase family protein [Arenimonas sp.]
MHPLLILPIAPLLLLQGLYVRKVTPRLPEATGARSGESGTGMPLRLLILGDSAAAGVGAEIQQQALAGQLAERLAGDYRLSWKLWAANGRTSGQCLSLLEQQAVEAFDTVLISLGVNDVTGGVALKKWLCQQRRLAELLHGKFSARHIIFTPLPPMQHFPALPQPLRWVLGARAKQFNRALQKFVATRPHCSLLAFELPMQPEFIASDGFHPSATTYALWADQAAIAIKRQHPV